MSEDSKGHDNRNLYDETALSLMDLRVTSAGFFTDTDRSVVVPLNGARTRRGPRRRISSMRLVSFVEIDSERNVMRVEFPEVISKQIVEPGWTSEFISRRNAS